MSTISPIEVNVGLYRIATRALSPFITMYLKKRLARGKEEPVRFRERLGLPTRPRPKGPLVWMHAASVGEALSVLPLMDRMLAEHEQLHLLLTTGTVTSAKLMAKRLPQRAFHQYVPVDRLSNVRPFLDHWQPDLGIWVESELWPNLIIETKTRRIPMVLLNARISEKSYVRWQKMPNLAKPLLDAFNLCVAQSLLDAGRFANLGCPDVVCRGNLKASAPPLPVDDRELDRFLRTVGNRPVWLAASTHPGEEDIAVDAHIRLRERYPDLLTIVVPRHPQRGPDLAAEIKKRGLAVARRGGYEPPRDDTELYLADTVGDLGLFYRSAAITFIGGSLIEHGGQNPLEAARLGCAILHGPHMENFQDSIIALTRGGAAEEVADGAALAAAIDRLLIDPDEVERRGRAAMQVIDGYGDIVGAVLGELVPFLPDVRARHLSHASG